MIKDIIIYSDISTSQRQVSGQKITDPSRTAGDGENDRDWRLVNEVLDLGHRDRLMRMNRGNRDYLERMDEGDDDQGPIDLFHFCLCQ